MNHLGISPGYDWGGAKGGGAWTVGVPNARPKPSKAEYKQL